MAKTQAQIDARLKAYKNGTVDSPFRITKLTYREPGYLPMQPGAIDADKRFNAQCMDPIIDYVLWFTDNKVRMWGDAKDAVNNKLEPYFTWHANTPDYVPPIGSIGVANHGTDGYIKYGHIYLVYGKANKDTMQVLEQNWNNQANLPPKLRIDNYYGTAGFWVPNVEGAKKETVKKTTTTQKTTVKKENTKKGKTLKYNRDEVTGYKLPKRGYKPKGVVIHNDAGSLSAMQYHDSLVNAPLSRLENGIAHSYISGNTVWQALPEGRIAWHTGDNYGNTNYYGIEGCRSMSASDKEFIETEQSTFQETARMLKKWGKPVNYETVKLHMEFVPTACPHRSMKLHTGWDPIKQGRPNQATINKLKDYFISQIEQYYDGKIPKGTTVTASKPSANTTAKTPSGWKKNKYGILWKKEKGTFTCKAKDGIVTRYKGPSIHNPIAGGLEYNQSVNYDEIQDYEGYIWISWEVYSGATVYMPIGKSNGKGQRVGSAWGTFK